MLIINADDWGRSRFETDAALSCYKAGRITSVSAMVFMEDSKRAAEIARGEGIDVGLHLNLSQRFTGECRDKTLQRYHDRIVTFLTRSKYSIVVYNPLLREEFRYVYHAQVEEFINLYGKEPSHVDGHHHKHLCANLLFDTIIPAGERVRRNFSFRKGEKGFLNRAYRNLADRWLTHRYRSTDYFYALLQYVRVNSPDELGCQIGEKNVELMVHPINEQEFAFLMGRDHLELLSRLTVGTYSML